VAGRPAVVPTITGTAWITSHTRFVLDSEDPFQAGFTVGDIWGAGTAAAKADE
jgi:proline racemase